MPEVCGSVAADVAYESDTLGRTPDHDGMTTPQLRFRQEHP